MRKAKNVIFIPSYHCVNNCEYCFQSHKAEKLSVEQELQIVDNLFKEILTREEFVSVGINIELMGGEYLLSSYESIKYIIDKVRNLQIHYDIKLEIQSTFSVDDEKKYDLIIENKDLFHRIGTTIDIPFVLHVKHRHDDFNKTLRQIKRMNEHGITPLVFHGLVDQIAFALNDFKNDLLWLNNNYDIHSTFINIFSNGFTMSNENQRLIVDYLFDNDLEIYALRNNYEYENKDFNSMIADFLIKLCDYQPICQIHSFYNNKLYCNCDRMSKEINFSPQIFKPILKDIREECRNCKWFFACYGGCPAQLKDNKYAFCEYRKAFLENIEKKYKLDVYSIIQKKLEEISKK